MERTQAGDQVIPRGTEQSRIAVAAEPRARRPAEPLLQFLELAGGLLAPGLFDNRIE